MKDLRPVLATRREWVENPAYDPDKKPAECVKHPYLERGKTTTNTVRVQREMELEGYFHQWIVAGDSGECCAYALVEDKSGKIYEIDTNRIRFTDR